LSGEAEGAGAGEAFEDAGVGEGFDDGVNVGGAAAGEAGDGVEEFFGDFIDGADAAEDGASEVGIGIGGVGAAGECGCACADEPLGARAAVLGRAAAIRAESERRMPSRRA
jgi:hypothetical protein